MRPGDLVLRGYAERDNDGSYFSIIIDLNIHACGDTAEEAIERCVLLTLEYITEAYSDDKEHFTDLIPRPAPLYFRLRYRYAQLACFLREWIHKHDGSSKPGGRAGPFKRPIPLVPAC